MRASILAVTCTAIIFAYSTAHAFCFEQAGAYYGISPRIIEGIAQVESRLNPTAINWNTNGTYDYGVMQINTIWEPVLRRLGIPWSSLSDPCTNVMAGSWILATQIQKYGYDWKAIGSYHSATPTKRDNYARKVAAVVFAENTRGGGSGN